MTAMTAARRFTTLAGAGVLLVGLPVATAPGQAAQGGIGRVSLSSGGVQGNQLSLPASVSADGRYVAFESLASNLVSGDNNNEVDIFVRDRQTGTTTLESLSSAGVQGYLSYDPSISADGRFVAFASAANNLVPGDTNGEADVFVRDRQTGTTSRVSVSSAGTQGDSDGSINQGEGSRNPSISADGRYVAFESNAAGLVPGDDNGDFDVFVRDRQTATTQRVAVEALNPAISSDGRYVAFDAYHWYTAQSYAVFVTDRVTGGNSLVSVATTGGQAEGIYNAPAISGDGRHVAFASSATTLVTGDSNNTDDVFVRDRQAGTTSRVNLSSAGAQSNGTSMGYDTGTAAISSDGRYVAFASYASNLVTGDTNGALDVFLRDRQAGTTSRVSVSANGTQGNDATAYAAISGNGRYMAFTSWATNLVSGDTNGWGDVFVADRTPATSTSVAVAPKADTYVNQLAKNTNYGTSKSLATRGATGKVYVSYLRFALPSAPAGRSLTGATLRIRTTGESSAGSGAVQTVRSVTGAWTESGTTYTTRPALGGTLGSLRSAPAGSTQYTITLDPAAVRSLLGHDLDVAVSGSSVDDSLWFNSRQTSTANYQPQLMLTFTS